MSERGAWRDWIVFFLDGVAEQARDAAQRARQLEDLRLRWRARLTQARASALPLQLMGSLFANPVVTIPQAQRLLGITYRSAQLNVGKLVDAGILRPAGESARGRSFVAESILSSVVDC